MDYIDDVYEEVDEPDEPDCVQANFEQTTILMMVQVSLALRDVMRNMAEIQRETTIRMVHFIRQCETIGELKTLCDQLDGIKGKEEPNENHD